MEEMSSITVEELLSYIQDNKIPMDTRIKICDLNEGIARYTIGNESLSYKTSPYRQLIIYGE